MGCGKRGNPGVFGMFVNCPECDSSRIMDADIWDLYGPKDIDAIPDEKNKGMNLQTETGRSLR